MYILDLKYLSIYAITQPINLNNYVYTKYRFRFLNANLNLLIKIYYYSKLLDLLKSSPTT